MEKRGQVTLFMVVGIMLLLSLSLLYYSMFIKDAQIKQAPNDEPVIQTTLPAKYLVDKCLSLVSTQATTLLGKRGGYIEYRPADLPSDMIRLTEKEELSMFYRRRSNNYAPLPAKYFFPNKNPSYRPKHPGAE